MEDNKDAQIIEQFVQNVEDFSSQYCCDLSESQTKFDLRGPPSNFPDSGNYYHRYVMRTYGPWWDEAPSFQEDYTPLNSGRIQSHDFVEVSFERAVYPLEVAVFETFNPGALVRIWALGLRSWVLLWEGEPENVGHTPRIFSPPIREVDFTTRILRLEFNHKLLPYYTELAAVLLKGKEPTNLIKRKSNSGYSLPFFKRSKPAIEKGVLLKEPSNLMPKDVNVDTGPPLGDFHRLPDETILSVFKYLDMQSLCRCAQVNKHFRRIACDATLYRCIDLRPYWHCLRSEVLVTLSMKCKFLQKLDLSWCGSHCMMQPRFVVNFLRQSGANLTHLRMNCCKFVDNSVLKAIVDTSSNLQELCLGSVVSCSEWSYLAYLTKLKRLYLYRTNISTSAAVAVVRSNPGLEHLNVGYCQMISPLDEVAIALGSNCPDLMSVDFSSAHSLTAVGFRALENCKKLQEVDLGWCFMEKFGYPGIIGCIDGTHVALIRPEEHEEIYFNRKNYHSLNVLLICDSKLNILHSNASFGGSSHDSFVWKACAVKPFLEGLERNGEHCWLLGDSGYAQRRWMMTPIIGAAPGSSEEYYIECHLGVAQDYSINFITHR